MSINETDSHNNPDLKFRILWIVLSVALMVMAVSMGGGHQRCDRPHCSRSK
jgi:hypothetical protein